MKRIFLATVAATLIASVAAAGPTLVLSSKAVRAAQTNPPTVTPTAETRTARVVDVFGTVERQAAGESAKTWHTVSVGDLLPEQTTLRTGSNGAALLQLPHSHLMRVGAGTTVLLRQMNDANQFSFKVLSGQVWSLVRKANHPAKYEVETPSAVAGVTGTIFSVAADAQTGETVVSTDEGSVQVREDGQSGQRTAVTGGNYVSVFRMPGRYGMNRPPFQARAQTDAMRQAWGLLRREGILDRRRDRDNAFSPVGGDGMRPLRLQRDLDGRLFRARFGIRGPKPGTGLQRHDGARGHHRRGMMGGPSVPQGAATEGQPQNPAVLPPAQQPSNGN